jgi:hypothetical protein
MERIMGMLLPDVTQLKSCYATLQLGSAKADGRLTLTEHLLHFESLNKQLNLGSYTIKLNTISRVERSTGKAAGIIPITRSGIKITTKQNHNIEFILPDPEQWLNSLVADH